jgi:hypothetical protein
LKRLNAWRVKIHRNYTVGEAARLFDIHKNTVRGWIKSGLPTIDDRRPFLILGRDLARFLFNRRHQRKQRCRSGQLYCLRCRTPKTPAAHMADYIPITAGSGNLRGLCPDCHGLMYRLVSLASLEAVAGNLDVQVARAQQRISDRADPGVNSDFNDEREPYADAQR